MVKIAIAGGAGNVGQEIIDVLVATKKHEILLLSRKDAPAGKTPEGVTWVKANYDDPKHLTEIFQGVHTVLSFIGETDPSSPVQKNLITASIQAGVKRFAPSEWASSRIEDLGWYTYKGEIRRYLKELNKDKKVLEYTLFQPGFFTNYLTYPYKSSNHISMMEVPFDFNKRRAVILDGSEDARISFLTVQDLANVVARAIDFEGEWPVDGGIRGTEITVGQLIALGEKIRGGPFAVEKLPAQKVEDGTWESSWLPRINHPSIPPEIIDDAFLRYFLVSILRGIASNSYVTSDSWNRLLPDYKVTQAEEFLSEAWGGKE